MLTNENGRKTKRLSREILGLLLITAVIALFFWGFLYLTANSISETYFTERNLQPSEGQWLTLRAWIRSVSLLSTVILFLVLFLFLLGQKLAYLREIIQGVDALRTHRLEDTIPLREANELLHSEAAYAKMAKAVNPYGDGNACSRIADAIAWHFGVQPQRPADFSAE